MQTLKTKGWRPRCVCRVAGEVEFLFVTDSADDPAHEELQRLANARREANRSVRVLVSGPSQTCSQKIHK